MHFADKITNLQLQLLLFMIYQHSSAWNHWWLWNIGTKDFWSWEEI